MLKFELDTAASEEPVTLAEAKAHLRIPSGETGDDTYVTALIAAAREVVEKITNRKLVTQTWKYFLDKFPEERSFELPYPKLQTVTWIKYYDEEAALTTLSTDIYQVDNRGIVGLVANKKDQSWPETEDERLSAVEVKFVCGYGAASAVPEAIKSAIKVLVATWYENREAIVVGVMASKVPNTVSLLLANYRVHSFE